jgi:hypothetical protein
MQRIFVVDGLFTAAELGAFRDFVDAQGDAVRQFTSSDFRNGKVLHEALPALLYERMRPRLPDVYTDANGVRWEPVGPCRFVMFAEMTDRQGFEMHTDTGCMWDSESNRYSRFTLLVYLNDDFTGGRTEFFDDRFVITDTVAPAVGRALAFDIELWHRGCEVTCGTKRWIGTEIVCSRMDP